MYLDESVYSDPTSFYPERYLPNPTGNGEPPFNAVFGFGRRFNSVLFMSHADYLTFRGTLEFVPGSMSPRTVFGLQ